VLNHNNYYYIKSDVYSYGRLIKHLFFGAKSLTEEENKEGEFLILNNNKL
jgi:hypothetical protein